MSQTHFPFPDENPARAPWPNPLAPAVCLSGARDAVPSSASGVGAHG